MSYVRIKVNFLYLIWKVGGHGEKYLESEVILLESFPDSLPMFTVLRKFTIPLTLLLETIILG